jgi:hypothetical protein
MKPETLSAYVADRTFKFEPGDQSRVVNELDGCRGQSGNCQEGHRAAAWSMLDSTGSLTGEKNNDDTMVKIKHTMAAIVS